MNQPRLQDHPFERPVTPMAGFQPPRVPDHELLRRIGRGAYGEVWLARSVTGAYRAVKIVHRHSFDHDRPFEREFSGILRFEPISRKDESQVDILHVGRGPDCFYYVMELADDQVSGQQIDPEGYAPKTLKSEIFQRGKLPFEECIQISLALTTALEHLHTNGLVHRDVKPSNIIFVNGVPKLADIGLVTGVEATRSFVGTEGFAPPEGPGTVQADLYSLGKVLYEISTGKDRQEFPELPTNLDELTEREGLLELNAVIAKACREEPGARYPSAKAMRDDLLLLQSGKSLARLHTMQRTVAKLKRASLAIAAVMVLALGAWLYQSHQTAQVKKLAADNLALAQRARENEFRARENLYAADINQAQQALAADNLRQALHLLGQYVPKPGEPDLRGFEWRYLWQQCQSEELFSLPGHNEFTTCVAFSPDGSRLVTGSQDHSARVWDLEARCLIATCTNDATTVSGAIFSPLGDVVALASSTNVCVRDALTWQLIRTLPGVGLKARFSPDGQYLVAPQTNGLVLWGTRTWRVAKSVELSGLWRKELLTDLASPEFGMAFSPDSAWLAVASDDGIKVLTVPDLEKACLLKERMPRNRFIAFSPNGRTLAAPGESDKDVELWDMFHQRKLATLSGHRDSVFAAVFSPDGKRLATGGPDQTIKIWDVESAKMIRNLRGHAAEVWDLAFSPDGRRLASVSTDGAVKVWDPSPAADKASEFRIRLPFGFSADGSVMLFKTNAVLTAVDPETLQEVGAQGFENPHEKGSYGFKVQFGNLSSDGVTAAMYIREDTNEIGSMDLFDLSRSRFLCSLKDVTSLKAAFAPKRHWIATGTRDRTVTLWQLPDGYRKLVLTNAESPLSFSADETMLATGAWNPGMTTVWKLDGPSAQRLCTIEINADCAAFSLNGTLLVTPDDSGFGGKLWSIPSGTPAGSFTGHTRPISQLSLSPDGRTLATVSDDGTLRLWQFATGRELMRFQMPRNDTDASWVLFSPDGRSLGAFTAIFDGALDGRFTRLWFAPSFDEISLAQGALPAQPRLTGPEWQVRAKALAQHGQFQQAIEGFGKVIELATGHPEWEALRVSALQHRSNLLRASSRLSEAAADNCAALRISPRDPRTPGRCVDLSAHFNGSLDLEPVNRVIPLPLFLEGIPRGIQVLDNVPFDLRGIIQINRKDGPTEVPVAVEGIPIRRKAACLHFLHATGWSEAENTLIGAYKIHYRDGTQQDVPLVYGKDLREWLCASDFADVPQARVIWSGYNSVRGPFRLFCRRWENPSPDVEIDSLDFVSNLTQCAPYLLAITADTAQGAGLAQTDR